MQNIYHLQIWERIKIHKDMCKLVNYKINNNLQGVIAS